MLIFQGMCETTTLGNKEFELTGATMPSPCLDHLVIAATSLEQGAAYVHEKLGVEMQAGGQHPRQGTHNLLLGLGKERYLEVIAIDPAGIKPSRPRWFELDSPAMQAKLRERPRLVTWVARTDDIHTSVQQCNVDIGKIQPMSRGDLNWQITIRADGSLPFEGLVPALIEWNTEQHPAACLPESHCRLVELEGRHPQSGRVQRALSSLALEKATEIKTAGCATEVGLRAGVATPSGVIVLD